MKIGIMPVRNLNILHLKENAFPGDKMTASFFPLSLYLEFNNLLQLPKADTKGKPT